MTPGCACPGLPAAIYAEQWFGAEAGQLTIPFPIPDFDEWLPCILWARWCDAPQSTQPCPCSPWVPVSSGPCWLMRQWYRYLRPPPSVVAPGGAYEITRVDAPPPLNWCGEGILGEPAAVPLELDAIAADVRALDEQAPFLITVANTVGGIPPDMQILFLILEKRDASGQIRADHLMQLGARARAAGMPLQQIFELALKCGGDLKAAGAKVTAPVGDPAREQQITEIIDRYIACVENELAGATIEARKKKIPWQVWATAGGVAVGAAGIAIYATRKGRRR